MINNPNNIIILRNSDKSKDGSGRNTKCMGGTINEDWISTEDVAYTDGRKCDAINDAIQNCNTVSTSQLGWIEQSPKIG